MGRRVHSLDDAVGLLTRLRASTYVDPATSCWCWLDGKSKKGYATLSVNNKTYFVHRLSAFINLGLDLFSSTQALHKCDNPACWNPEHLFLGTNLENHQDSKLKGRARNQHTGKRFCHKGHEFTESNTTYRPDGSRECRTCKYYRYTPNLYRNHVVNNTSSPVPESSTLARESLASQSTRGD